MKKVGNRIIIEGTEPVVTVKPLPVYGPPPPPPTMTAPPRPLEAKERGERMTKLEEQAMAVAKAWRTYTQTDHRLAEDREASRKGAPRRDALEREEDARNVRPAESAYKKELEILAQMML